MGNSCSALFRIILGEKLISDVATIPLATISLATISLATSFGRFQSTFGISDNLI